MSQNWDNELKSEPIDMRDSPLLAEELGLLIDAATNYAIYMTDPDGIVTIWNRGAERIKGWSSADIIGQHFSLFYPPEDIAAAKPQADLDRAAAEGRVEEESWRIRKDGSEFLASITMTALHDADGALRGFGTTTAPWPSVIGISWSSAAVASVAGLLIGAMPPR